MVGLGSSGKQIWSLRRKSWGYTSRIFHSDNIWSFEIGRQRGPGPSCWRITRFLRLVPWRGGLRSTFRDSNKTLQNHGTFKQSISEAAIRNTNPRLCYSWLCRTSCGRFGHHWWADMKSMMKHITMNINTWGIHAHERGGEPLSSRAETST